MSPVSRSTPAGRVYLELQQLARATQRPTDELLRTYVLERFLWRVGKSHYRNQLILKGGMLMAVLGERRPTADVDMLAENLSNDLDAVSAVIADVLSIESEDGVEYAVDELRVARIRDDDVYPGARVSVPAKIDRARAVLRVDVNVGDPVTPAPVEIDYPAMLGRSFSVVGYPFESVLAEKIVTMIDRGELNTRERDFADVYLLSGRLNVEGRVLMAAINATATHRGSQRQPLAVALDGLGNQRQSSWKTYLENAGLDAAIPTSYSKVIEEVAAFADPAITSNVAGLTWNPSTRHWIEPLDS